MSLVQASINFLAQLQKRGVFTRVVIITAQYNRLIIPHLFKAGAAAYLSKKISSDYFIEVVRLVMKNDYYLSAEQFSVFKSNYSLEVQEEQNAFLEVSERDIQLIYLMANQLTAKEISDRLCVSVKSVEAYKNQLFLKTGTKNTLGLVIFALKHGLLDLTLIQGKQE